MGLFSGAINSCFIFFVFFSVQIVQITLCLNVQSKVFLCIYNSICFDEQPMSMVLPGVVGFKLSGKLGNGVTATDLVLTVTQILRKHGVVGKFVEFYGNLITLITFL